MAPSYEYVQFVNEKVMPYLPQDRVRIGDKVNFRCPFCGDSRKSATKRRGFFYLSNASYYCFNCGLSMSGMKLLEALSGQDYADIKREYLRAYARSGFSAPLSSYAPPTEDEPRLFGLKPMVRPEWKKPLSEDARGYLAGRMVDRAPFLRDPLYSCDGRGGEYILIPWVVCGVEAYYQLNDYRKIGPVKYVFPKSSKKLVYGLDNVDPSWPYVVVFEGVYDSLFVKNAVAVGTKSVTKYQLDLIRERWPRHRIAVSFDNDGPGLASMSRLVQKGGEDLFFRWFGADTAQKDVNDYVLATGRADAFSDPSALEGMMLSPLQMKMWLIENGKWAGQQRPRPAARREPADGGLDLASRRRLFE